jgi:hypothetical protein
LVQAWTDTLANPGLSPRDLKNAVEEVLRARAEEDLGQASTKPEAQ